MIRIDLIRHNTNHPDKRHHHPDGACCVVGRRRFESPGPAAVHRLAKVLCLRGHGNADFEVWDDHEQFGGLSRVVIVGNVRHWARLATGKPVFSNDESFGLDFLSRAVPNPSRVPRRNEPPPVVHLWIKRAIEALEVLENE